MPTMIKTIDALSLQGRIHRSKRDIAYRREAEKALATGTKLTMRSDIRSDPEAKRVFLHSRRLLDAIGKNDGLFNGCINDHALLCADQVRQNRLLAALNRSLDEIREAEGSGIITSTKARILQRKFEYLIHKADKQNLRILDSKLVIEHQNLMTVKSAEAMAMKQKHQKTAKATLQDILHS